MYEFRSNPVHRSGHYENAPVLCPHRQLIFNGFSLQECTKVKIVGITFTDSLLWTEHIDNIARRARCRLGVLRKLRPFLSKADLTNVYTSHVRSMMEYCSPIWMGAGKSSLQKLDKVQLSAIKHFNIDRSLPALATRRFGSALCQVKRLIHSPNLAASFKQLLPPRVAPRETRRSDRLKVKCKASAPASGWPWASVPQTSTVFQFPQVAGKRFLPVFAVNSFIHLACSMWENVVPEIVEEYTTTQDFKRFVKAGVFDSALDAFIMTERQCPLFPD